MAIEVISSLQIIQGIFRAMKNMKIHNQTIIRGMFRNIAYITGSFEFQSISCTSELSDPIWALCMCYLGFHILLAITIIYMKLSKKLLHNSFLKFSGYLYLAHSRIGFFVVQSLLLGIQSACNSNTDSTQNSRYNGRNWLGVTIVLSIINFALALIPETLLCHLGSRRSAYAVKTNLYHGIVLLYKVLSLVLSDFDQSLTSVPQVIASIHLLVSSALVQIVYTKLPFMNFKILKMITILSAVILSLSFNLFLQSLTSNNDFHDGLQVCIVILPILTVKVMLSITRNLFERIIKSNSRNSSYAIHHALIILEIVQHNKETSSLDKDLFPNGYISNGVLSKNKIEVKTSQEGPNPQLLNYIMEKLEQALNFNKKSKVLLLFMAQLYLERLDNALRAIELIKRLESFTLSIPMRSSVADFYLKVQNMYGKHQTNPDNPLELSNHLQYSKRADLIKEYMLREVERHIDFWTKLNSGVVDIKEVVEDAEEIDKLSEIVNRGYEGKNLKLQVLLRAVYLINVRSNIQEGTQMFKRFQVLSKDHLEKDHKDPEYEDTAILILSVDKKKLGEVLDASGGIRNIFSVSKRTVIGKNFGCFFPSIIARELQFYIYDYVSLSNQKLGKRHSTYGKTKDGDLFGLEAYFSLYFYLNKEITIMLTLKKTSCPQSIFIAGHDGTILEYSKALERIFSRERLELRAFKSMQEVSSQFGHVNLAYNITYGKDEGVIQQPGLTRGQSHREMEIEMFKSFRSETGQLLSSPEVEGIEIPEDSAGLKSQTKCSLYDFQASMTPKRGDNNQNFSPGISKTPNTRKDSVVSRRKSTRNMSIFHHQNRQAKREEEITTEQALETCQTFNNGSKLQFSLPADDPMKKGIVLIVW